jgi:hypothetical protein
VAENANPAVPGTTPIPPNLMAAPMWQFRNCKGPQSMSVNCLRVEMLDGSVLTNRPIVNASGALGDVPAFRVTFGPGDAHDFNPLASGTPSAVAQTVTLTSGYYRLSWFGRAVHGIEPRAAVSLRVDSDLTVEMQHSAIAQVDDTPLDVPVPTEWLRFHEIYYVPATMPLAVALLPSGDSGEKTIDVAGIMLESMSRTIVGAPDVGSIDVTNLAPSQYIATTIPGTGMDAVCEDVDGSVFRSNYWSPRTCVKLCPGGYDTCPDGYERCYREFDFPLTMEGIDSGGILARAGFAYGNINYRIDGISVNFVGTGIKDCSGSQLPSTCQSNASVPFSLEHGGDLTVRNHEGNSYHARLFTGNIEFGRGLAAERYITNPMSGADRALIEPYTHHELRGRPLTGTYKLRVWEDAGVYFGNIEDVQLVIDYRYWTRFGR